MAAFNWIVFGHTCPNCGCEANIKAQCHVASSFDGDDSGRFCDREYRLGERMRWWDEYDGRYASWKADPGIVPDASASKRILECCYARCSSCHAELFAVIAFHDITAVDVQQVGLEG
jgi:hypothetical protein